MLFQLWKKDELFKYEIIDKDTLLASWLHCIMFMFDGYLYDMPNGGEYV